MGGRMSDQQRIGFIGLGNIGKPMAKHLAEGNFDLYVYDVMPQAVDELLALGAKTISPKEMAQTCEHIGLCVRDSKDIESLLYGDDGLLEQGIKGTIIAIHSTVTQINVIKWVDEAKAYGIDIIDAPMTGGASGAEEGTLCYMVGGDIALLDKSRPIFETSAEKIIHAGPVGMGVALKLCNNLMTTDFASSISLNRWAARCCKLWYEPINAPYCLRSFM